MVFFVALVHGASAFLRVPGISWTWGPVSCAALAQRFSTRVPRPSNQRSCGPDPCSSIRGCNKVCSCCYVKLRIGPGATNPVVLPKDLRDTERSSRQSASDPDVPISSSRTANR